MDEAKALKEEKKLDKDLPQDIKEKPT